MNEIIKAEDIKTMTSTQLAEMLGMEKTHINRDIKKIFSDKIVSSIIGSSIDSRGYISDYHLPELESKMFVAKKDINYLEKITQYWIDQGKSLPNFSNPAEAAIAWAEEYKAKEKALLQIEQDKPKIDFVNVVTKSAESLRIGEYAKILSDSVGIKIGSNKLMKFFREQGYLMKGRDSREKNKPFQSAIDNGLFEFKIESPRPNFTVSVTYITGKGQFNLKEEVLMHFA
jgi:phage antirepressor YoqD-like protein